MSVSVGEAGFLLVGELMVKVVVTCISMKEVT